MTFVTFTLLNNDGMQSRLTQEQSLLDGMASNRELVRSFLKSTRASGSEFAKRFGRCFQASPFLAELQRNLGLPETVRNARIRLIRQILLRERPFR
jgi:hypothetical protein